MLIGNSFHQTRIGTRLVESLTLSQPTDLVHYLHTAKKLFLNKGYSKTSVNDIDTASEFITASFNEQSELGLLLNLSHEVEHELVIDAFCHVINRRIQQFKNLYGNKQHRIKRLLQARLCEKQDSHLQLY